MIDMAKLTSNVVVTHPESGLVEFLAEGSDLPGWATDLVGDHVLDGAVDEPADPYKGAVKADLKAEIDARNADRDDEHQIVPVSDKNEDLIAALVADDQPSDN